MKIQTEIADQDGLLVEKMAVDRPATFPSQISALESMFD